MTSDTVTVFDLRSDTVVASLRGSSLPLALTAAGIPSVDDPGTGIVRPFSIVMIDAAERLVEHADVFGRLAEPSVVLRTIVVVMADDGETIKGTVLPEVLDSPAINMLWVSNPAGTSWVPGATMAEGFGAWPHDPDGIAAFGSLIDTLTIPEVFDEAFVAMSSSPSQVHTPGLRRWVFSLDSGQSISDFVYEAGAEIAGTRGIDPSRDEPRFWNVPAELTGGAESDAVFMPIDGSVVDLLDKAERRVGSLHRLAGRDDATIVANTEEQLVNRAEACGAAFDELIETGIELVESVDATDGIDESEHAAVKKLGVNLHPGYKAPSLLDVSDDMLASVTWDLERGHSLEPLLARMASDADAISVPDQKERVAELERFKESAAREQLDKASDTFPRSFWSGLLGRNWHSLDWRLGALVAAVFSLIGGVLWFVQSRITSDKGFDVGCGWDAVCDASTEIFDWGGWLYIIGGLTVVALGLIPLLIFGVRRMARLIRDWIDDLGGRQIVSEARKFRQHVASIVLNDWVLGAHRTHAAEMLATARETLQGVADVVSDQMMDEDVVVSGAVITQQVNPQIEQNLNVAGGAVLYRAFSPIVELIRLDAIELITRTVRSFWPRLQARSGEQIPEQVAATVRNELETYIASLTPQTLLSSTFGDTDSEHRRRAALEKLWQEGDLVAETVRATVEAGPDTEMLQMVGLRDLPVLDSSSDASEHVRFAPTLARNQVRSIQSCVDDECEVVFTEHLTTAGVLRLVPVRDGVVVFSSSVEGDYGAA